MNEFDNVHSCTFFARQKQGSKSTMPLWLLLILPLHRTLARLPQGQPAALARLPSTLSGTFNSSEKKCPQKCTALQAKLISPLMKMSSRALILARILVPPSVGAGSPPAHDARPDRRQPQRAKRLQRRVIADGPDLDAHGSKGARARGSIPLSIPLACDRTGRRQAHPLSPRSIGFAQSARPIEAVASDPVDAFARVATSAFGAAFLPS